MKTVKGKYGIEYLDIPVSFDIETSNFYEYKGMQIDDKEICNPDGSIKNIYKKYVEARASMWGWSLCIGEPVDKNCCIGRTWEEFTDLLKRMKEKWNLSPKRRLIIYVHNLGFDMCFFQYWLDWTGQQVSRGNARPIYAVSKDGFEFRCSWALTNCKLEDVQLYKPEHKDIKKLVGTIDYNLIRNSETVLTDQEKSYMRADVKVINALIIEEREIYGSVAAIPLTMAAKTRKYMDEHLLDDPKMQEWMENSTIDAKRYEMLRDVYNGGYIDSSPLYTATYSKDVNHIDLKSEYPSTLIYEKFPFGRGEYIGCPKDEKEFKYIIDNKCCIFKVKIYGIKSKNPNSMPLRLDKAKGRRFEYPVEKDGKILSAEIAELTVNEVQFKYLWKYYDWKTFQIKDMIVYDKRFLPSAFVRCVLELFQNKENATGKIAELAKILINAIYGCCSMDINKKKYKVTDTCWTETNYGLDKAILKYNDQLRRHEKWTDMKIGIWCASYSARNLLYGIEQMGSDYISANTDSIFYVNDHDDYINKYNEQIVKKANRVAHGLSIPVDRFIGKNGVYLGQWKKEDFDFVAQKTAICRMKALSGQRYIIEEKLAPEALKKALNDEDQKRRIYDTDKILHWTVSGPGEKKGCAEFLVQKSINEGVDPFELFDEDLQIPAESAKRPQHTKQIDRGEFRGRLTDYTGHTADYYERSFIHIGRGAFNLSERDQAIDDIIDGWQIDKKGA